MTSKNRFAGRCVVVTGAASGMGLATAQAFAEAGANVVLSDVAVDQGEAAASDIRGSGGFARFQRADVSREQDVQSLVEDALQEFGSLDVMVNNAGVLGDWLPIAEQTAETLDLVLGVNIKGAVFGMKHAISAMRPKGQGVVVNIASVQGFRVAYPGAAFYAASKAAVVSLTKSAALEYGRDGIRVVGIAPGPIDTPMLRSRAGNEWPPAIVEVTPLARLGEPREIARAVLWLASDDASYITGTTVPVDGGFLAP